MISLGIACSLHNYIFYWYIFVLIVFRNHLINTRCIQNSTNFFFYSVPGTCLSGILHIQVSLSKILNFTSVLLLLKLKLTILKHN